MFNPLLRSDTYKLGHLEQYCPGTNKVYSYFCNRSNKNFDTHVFFGLQYYLDKYLSIKLEPWMAEDFIEVYESILGPCPQGTIDKIKDLTNLGYFPLEIKALPEGVETEAGVPLFTIQNTIPGYHWVVGFVESVLLKVWYSSVVATTSRRYKKLVEDLFTLSVDDENRFLIPFMVHDFGYRGDSSEEGAALSGCAHLLNFVGSDTITAFRFSQKYYEADLTDGPIMLSVPASEHSVACSFGRYGELDYINNMLDKYPTGIVSIVSDQYDVYEFFDKYLREVKDKILSREGKTVLRPDSGSQYHVICGYGVTNYGSTKEELLSDLKNMSWCILNTDRVECFYTSDGHYIDLDGNELTELEVKGCLQILDDIFGHTVNTKGYKVLNDKIGLIYGDGMYYEKYKKVQERILEMGYSSENLIIGVGGILRNHSRDTIGSAIKATSIEVNGEQRNIFKDPITDKGKKSACGLLKVFKEDDKYKFVDQVTEEEEKTGELKTVFLDGKLTKKQTFEEICEILRVENVK